MKKIVIALIALLGATTIAGWQYLESNKLCGAMFSWGRNTQTGQCRYFESTCLNKGYEEIGVRDCDCDELEDYLQPNAYKNCISNQKSAVKRIF